MPYGSYYRLRFNDVTGEEIEVRINDTATYSPTPVSPTVTDIVHGDGVPFYISVVDNDSDKFRPIRAKRVTISFQSTETITARTFAVGEDSKWLVEAFVIATSEIIFTGFLVMDDHAQAFLPPETYTVKLTATDNLGTLKEQSLTKPDGTIPKGPFKIIEWIAWALQKTGLQLPIIVTTSWMEESYQDLPAWDHIYLHSKTFEGSEVGSMVDCYKVLEIIFGFDCDIQQRNGQWWIRHIDEMTGNVTYKWTFSYQGSLLSTNTPTVYSKTIGFLQPINLAHADAIIRFIRPHKFVKLRFAYEFPREIVDNIDFSRGGVLTVVSPTETDYHLEDWTVGRWSLANILTPTSTSVPAYIVRTFLNGYEKERYAVVRFSTETNPYTYIRSNAIALGIKDRGTVSVDFRFSVSTVGNNVNPMALVMKGNSGATWLWTGSIWLNTASLGSLTFYFFSTHYTYSSSDEKVNWQSVSTSFTDAPEDGDLYLFLSAGYTNGGTGTPDAYYQNLRFDYAPYINGSYQKYNGHYHMVSQAGNYKANIDEEIKIGEAPRKNMKGALLKLVAGKYVLAGRWYRGGDLTNLGITPPIGSIYLFPFGQLQIYAVWNQYKNRTVELSGSLYGLSYSSLGGFPDTIHNYQVDTGVTASEEVDNKNFMLVGMDQDSRSHEWRGVLVETFDTTIARDYSSPHEFKYLSDY